MGLQRVRHNWVTFTFTSLSTYDPAILLLSIYTKQIKMLTRKDTCTPMFMAALFTITKICKQHKCSLIKDVAYIFNGTYFKNKKGLKQWNLTSCDSTKDLRCVVLSKTSQTRKKQTLYEFHLYVEFKKPKQMIKHNKTETEL